MRSEAWPINIRYLKSLAVDLLRWYENFLTTHPDLKAVWSRSPGQSSLVQPYKKTCTAFCISDDDQYNVEEKGFMRGIGDDAKVLVPVTEEISSIQPEAISPKNVANA
ncbi:uncharacterized protein Z518_08072 [Rhinocladiella mackenziei CBS 650.93]|uniref:Uncharacterized protein n=1 Tax=Rhinocladiella mackenziei CBS 650.93 TaxID=1442369 RepID=A0A0D2GV31_9EURO|nr:uncharacterized protein Z518_08072 [Rhinocladiella mackenziei CBS 650.93]KIX02133.1 hypothetical protein Z518_08072 [Rhinocladiella mackenziei CBS 650.93]